MDSIFRPVTGVFGFVFFTFNILFWIIPIILFSLIKLLIPIKWIRDRLNRLLDFCASCWISTNSFAANYLCTVQVRWPAHNPFSTNDWFLVVANHQSWVDIYVLQKIFNKKIPFLKFFLKKELIYVPLLGVAWWALDFPFMKRHSKSYLKKHPHKKGQDLATTRKACEKFRHIPISVMNFVEGTRYTEVKAKRQNSPYKHLLKPKSGGIGTVLSILGEQMHTLVDVTIQYPSGVPTFWDFLSGKIDTIEVTVNTFEISADLIGDMNESDTRIRVQSMLNQLWQNKDNQLENSLTRITEDPESQLQQDSNQSHQESAISH